MLGEAQVLKRRCQLHRLSGWSCTTKDGRPIVHPIQPSAPENACTGVGRARQLPDPSRRAPFRPHAPADGHSWLPRILGLMTSSCADQLRP